MNLRQDKNECDGIWNTNTTKEQTYYLKYKSFSKLISNDTQQFNQSKMSWVIDQHTWDDKYIRNEDLRWNY